MSLTWRIVVSSSMFARLSGPGSTFIIRVAHGTGTPQRTLRASRRANRSLQLENKKKSWVGVTLQIFFVVWLIVINALYYMQYSGLLVSRFGFWFHRWR
jgi:hypothetical protein